MWTVSSEIEKALEALNLPASSLRRCDEEESRFVKKEAMEIFVENHPRSWWLSLKTPSKSITFKEGDAYKYVKEYIPNNEKRCWFIAESDENDENDFLVFEGMVSAVMQLLGECCYFEYYLLGKNFDWLIIENDHNEMIVTHRA